MFFVIIHDKTSNLELVNVPKKMLKIEQWNQFHQHKMLCYIQHSKQVAYQAGIWTTNSTSQQELPSTEGYGWQLNEQCKWSPVWITFPVASKACNECLQEFDGAVEEDVYVHARRHNKNALNNVAATVRSVVCYDILIMHIYIYSSW